MDFRLCKSSGAEIPEETSGSCPKCGAALPLSGTVKKQPILAVVASFIIPGLGQSYNGNALKGSGLFLGVVILWILIVAMKPLPHLNTRSVSSPKTPRRRTKRRCFVLCGEQHPIVCFI